MGIILNRRRVCGGGEKPLPEGLVDLGLPSGTLWAKGNIVKDGQGNYAIGNETDYGCYFSWGNIDGHNISEGYVFSTENYNASPGSTLRRNISPTDVEHDAALARLGNGWRLPTSADFAELTNSAYTTIVQTSRNGVAGKLVTSKINGNSLFLPATGSFRNSTNNFGTVGNYWSSMYYEANVLSFTYSKVNPAGRVHTYYGITVRAVYKS